MTIDELLERIAAEFGETVTFNQFRDNRRLICSADLVYTLLSALKNRFGFNMLVDVTAVDYLEYPKARDRFGVIYCLLGTEHGLRVYVKVMINEPDLELPSVVPLWSGANWMEREVFDMFGIKFSSHPDLRRILLPDEFVSYPLRKDYPLRGRGERHNFPILTRAEG